MNKKLTERLKKLRTDKEISQSKLATILGVAQTTVAAWEVGRNEPDTQTLMQLSIFYDITVDYLIGFSNNMYHNENNDTVATINIGSGSKINGNVKINNSAKK